MQQALDEAASPWSLGPVAFPWLDLTQCHAEPPRGSARSGLKSVHRTDFRAPFTLHRQAGLDRDIAAVGLSSTFAGWRDPHHTAGMRPRKGALIVIQNGKLHGFWAAKTWGAFSSSSLHSPGKQSAGLSSDPSQTLRPRFSHQSCAFLRKRFWSGSGGSASFETIFTH